MGSYFCRLCDSDNSWVKPSRYANEKSNSHFARYGFAYEEWNLNPSLHRDGYQHGWLQAFTSNAVIRGKHDVALYVRRDQTNLLVGRIWDCENTSGTDLRIRYPATFAEDLQVIPNLAVTVDSYNWNLRRSGKLDAPPLAYSGEPLTNIRFKLESYELLETPIKLDFRYTRYGSLCVDQCKNEKEKEARRAIWRRIFPDRAYF